MTDGTVLEEMTGGRTGERLRTAGMANPQIVPAGAEVSTEVINARSGTVRGLMITGSDVVSSPVPMMLRMRACLAGLHRNVIVLHGMAQECPPKLDL
jgi:hypothetical protein